MIPPGEDIGAAVMGNSITFWNLTMTRDMAWHLLSFYQEQNLLISISAKPTLNEFNFDH